MGGLATELSLGFAFFTQRIHKTDNKTQASKDTVRKHKNNCQKDKQKEEMKGERDNKRAM